MTRLTLTRSALPRPAGATGRVLMLAAAAAIAAGVGALLHSRVLVIAIAIVAVLAIVATVVFSIRSRRRTELADLFLLGIFPRLGWPEPSRSALTVRGWHGGWIGRPRRLRLAYNPLADESVVELIAEARRLAQRRFGATYKVAKHHERRAQLWLLEHDPEQETAAAAQTERVKTIVAQKFGDTSTASIEFDDEKPKRIDVHYSHEVATAMVAGGRRLMIENTFGALLEGRWRAFWDLLNDTVRLELRPTLADLIPTPNIAPDVVDPLASYDGLEVPIGLDEDGHVISWKPKRDPHGLVTGKTGKGKTVVLLGIVMYLAAHGWKVWGIDGKRIELLGLRNYPNVQLIAGRVDHQARVAHEMYEMMQRRFEDYEAGRVKLEEFEPVLFVIDEYKTFRNAVTRWYRSVKPKGSSTQPPTLEEISDFVSLARKARMHLLIGLQRPDAEFLTGDMRDNFNFRVSLGRLSPEGAKMMWDSFSTGVAIPPFAIGRGIAHNASGTPVEIQTYWTPDPYQTDPQAPDVWVNPGDGHLVDQLRPRVTLHDTMQILEPDNWVDLDDEKSTKDSPDFLDYMSARIVSAGAVDNQPIRQAAGIFTPRIAELERIHAESEEPDTDDGDDDLFAGYSDSETTSVDELLDDSGDLTTDGALALVDADAGTWGLIESGEYDPMEDGYVLLSYRDFLTGEPGAVSVSADERLPVRLPKAA